MKSSLSVISLKDPGFGVASIKPLSSSRPSRFSPVLSSRGVIVLCATFVSVGHFVKDISSVFTFLFLACGCLAVPGPLAEKTTCVPLSKIS